MRSGCGEAEFSQVILIARGVCAGRQTRCHAL